MDNNRCVEYIRSLQKARGFTSQEISNLSKVPKSTIDKILSGLTADPLFSTIAAIVIAMGGSLDEMMGLPPRQSELKSAEATAYEKEISRLRQRLEDRDQAHEKEMNRLVDAHKNATEHLKDNLKWQRIMILLLLAFLLYIFIDASNAGWGALKFRQMVSGLIGFRG